MSSLDEVLYHYFTPDEDIFEDGKVVSPCKIKGNNFFTGCVIVANKIGSNDEKQPPDLMAKVISIKEEMLVDSQEKRLSGWVELVHRNFKEINFDAPIIFELRPFCTKPI